MDNHRNCTYYAEFHNTKQLRMGCLQGYNRTRYVQKFLVHRFSYFNCNFINCVSLQLQRYKKNVIPFLFQNFFLKICSFTWLYQEKHYLSIVDSRQPLIRQAIGSCFLYDSCLQKYIFFCNYDNATLYNYRKLTVKSYKKSLQFRIIIVFLQHIY